MTFGLRPTGISPSLRASVIAWWKLDGNSNDASGNGHNGTDTAITYTTGKINQAASFNGTTSKITVPDSDAFSFNGGSPDKPFSISLWDYTVGGLKAYLSKGSADFLNTNEYDFFFFGSEIYLRLRDKTTNGTFLGVYASFGASFNAYNHIVATYDGSGTVSGIKIIS